MQSKAAEVIPRCRQLAQITDVPGETTRRVTRDAHQLLGEWMRSACPPVRMELDVETALRTVQAFIENLRPHELNFARH